MDVYEFVRGPLAWIALILFVLGCLYRIFSVLYSGKKEHVLDPSANSRNAARSILYGLLPFGSTYMRRQPLLTVISYTFHLSVIIVPLFLLAHIVLWYESWGIQWWSLPDLLADLMAYWVMLSCGYFFYRRLTVPEVRQVTRPADFGLLALIFLTFSTGFFAYHQWGPYRPILILHILSSEVLLVILPFSKLGHMLTFAFSRAYMGAEFGKHMKARDF